MMAASMGRHHVLYLQCCCDWPSTCLHTKFLTVRQLSWRADCLQERSSNTLCFQLHFLNIEVILDFLLAFHQSCGLILEQTPCLSLCLVPWQFKLSSLIISCLQNWELLNSTNISETFSVHFLKVSKYSQARPKVGTVWVMFAQRIQRSPAQLLLSFSLFVFLIELYFSPSPSFLPPTPHWSTLV